MNLLNFNIFINFMNFMNFMNLFIFNFEKTFPLQNLLLKCVSELILVFWMHFIIIFIIFIILMF